MKLVQKLTKRVTSLLLTVSLLSFPISSFAAFSADAGHWAKPYIDTLAAQGAITTEDNGVARSTFSPNNQITRAELTKMAVETLLGGVDELSEVIDQNDPSFTDVPSSAWFFNYIEIARLMDYVGGYDDNTFKPNNNITRAEALKIISNAGELPERDASTSFGDISGHWAEDVITSAAGLCIIDGSKPAFNPNSSITRGEVAKIIVNAYKVANGEEICSNSSVAPSESLEGEHVITGDVADGYSYTSYAPATSVPLDRENYNHFEENAVKRVSQDPVSTFSIDVDTGSYANVRRFLNSYQLPRQDAVRVEEMINYFSYDYPVPENKETPFLVNTEIAKTPWNENTKLLHIGVKGYEKQFANRPHTNLVFLLDVSGSMSSANKLGLLKESLIMLSKNLGEQDKISIVTYAGSTGVVLDGVNGDEVQTIESALQDLRAGGGTAGAAGIDLAYKAAEDHFIEGGINRILLATDGDFNVGTTNFEALIEMVEQRRENGVSLTTLGFGTGNYNDHLMEQLADAGNGNYAYIDSIKEAEKVLVIEAGSTFETIAKDVKIQIEFNPEKISEYRLIGYENRILNDEDFENDEVDAGEIGAGHTVTALYEIALVGEGGEKLPELRYQDSEDTSDSDEELSEFSDEYAFFKIRHKKPDGDVSELQEFPITTGNVTEEPSDNFHFSAAVAAFGQKLREGTYLEGYRYQDILELAEGSMDQDTWGYRGEFLELVGIAKELSGEEDEEIVIPEPDIIIPKASQKNAWVTIHPVQCLNDWENDWKEKNPEKDYPASYSEEGLEIIKEYYKEQGIDIIDIIVQHDSRADVCGECGCGSGTDLYIEIDPSDLEKAKELGFSESESPFTWVSIETIQCLENPWEKDWIENNPDKEYPQGSSPEEVIKRYYLTQGIEILQIESKSMDEAVCEACSCSAAYDLYLKIYNENLEDMLELGFTESEKEF